MAVVTGAGSGIGREIAIALAWEGTHLALCDISEKGIEETRNMLQPADVNVSRHQVDASKVGIEIEPIQENAEDAGKTLVPTSDALISWL